MAIATGVWGNSSESCEAKWDDYVKDNNDIWQLCNISYCESELRDRFLPRICDDAELIVPSRRNLGRKEFMYECSPYNDLKHFNQDSRKSRANSRQRKHHYIFDVNHKGVDFSGFIVHSANKHYHGHRLMVYLDANDNGRFDKKDELIGVSKLKNMHSHNGVGGILDSGEIGKVKVEFKRNKSNASMRSAENQGNTVVDSINASSIYEDISDIIGTQPKVEPPYSVTSIDFTHPADDTNVMSSSKWDIWSGDMCLLGC